MAKKTIKGYKAFNKDMTCRGFQYKEGETYECKEVSICDNGFHFCENPLDILDYYNLCESEFHEVEGLGKFDKHKEDSKVATTKIKIGVKVDLKAFVSASIDFVFKSCKFKNSAKQASSGDYAKQASSGYYAQQASSGDSAQQASSGDSAQSEINGKYSVSASIGRNSKIRGKKGNWITLAEYDNGGKPICVKSAQIDGKKIKEDTWYILKNKKFCEVRNG